MILRGGHKMLIDLFAQDNVTTFNSYIANKYGLQLAIYLQELLTLYRKAYYKDMLKGGWIKLERDYITARTTLTVEEQIIIDEQLEKMCIISRKKDSEDLIKLDLNKYISLMSDDTMEVVDMAIELKNKASKSKTQQERTANSKKRNMKSYVVQESNELRQAYYDWIDSVVDAGKTLTKISVQQAQKLVDECSGGDLNKSLYYVNTAAILAYQNMEWAISSVARNQSNSYNPYYNGTPSTLPAYPAPTQVNQAQPLNNEVIF